MTRPSGLRSSSVGLISASHVRPVASKTADRRFEAVSSGPKSRKFVSLRAIDVSQERAEDLRRLTRRRGRLWDVDRVVAEVREDEVAQQLAAVRVRVRAHPALALRRERGKLGDERPALVEELLGPVAREPFLEEAQVVRVAADLCDRNLMRAPRPLDRQPVDLFGAGPALRRPQHDHRPTGTPLDPVVPGGSLDLARCRRAPRRAPPRTPGAPARRLVAGDDDRPPAASLEERDQLVLGDPGEHRRVRDLVAVQVQDREHRAVGLSGSGTCWNASS